MRYFLDLDDGRPPIECRDEEQADMLVRLYLAFKLGPEGREVIRDYALQRKALKDARKTELSDQG